MRRDAEVARNRKMKSKITIKRSLVIAFTCAASLVAIATESFAAPTSAHGVVIDGSSTVFPISEAVAEEFQRANSTTSVTVGVSGTGGGFKKFLAGEVDIVNASRPIKSSELEFAQMSDIAFVELPIAYDALSVVVNKKNTWVDHLTVAELKKIWSPESQGKVMKWSDIRPGFPDKPLRLFGPGTDSGTFDYFTEVVCGKEDASRGDYTSSEDDNVIVKGVEGDEGALGYFGVAFYEANKSRLKVVPIDDEQPTNGVGPQLPTSENVLKAVYSPLARPLFIYVRASSLDKPDVSKFVSFYLENAKALSTDVGYIALPDASYAQVSERYSKKVVGTLFDGKSAKTGVTLEQLLSAASKG
ncbi:MAG: phosphate transport system substrate-binding protein [Pseudomonadota bacterium]|jgi:phosphate transport system substrate-binding protein